MTKLNHTHITLVIDRSGSMSAVRTDAEGAINHFISEQKQVEGTATVSLIDFDAPNARDGGNWYNIRYRGDLQGCHDYHLHPRGSTALLDAIGRAITETGEYLANKPEDERPSTVIFVVQTDGQENSSVEWTLEKVQEAIKQQSDEWNWTFVFLGMGPDTFNQGIKMGFDHVSRSANTGQSHSATYAVLTDSVARTRGGDETAMMAMDMEVDEQGQVKQRMPWQSQKTERLVPTHVHPDPIDADQP